MMMSLRGVRAGGSSAAALEYIWRNKPKRAVVVFIGTSVHVEGLAQFYGS